MGEKEKRDRDIIELLNKLREQVSGLGSQNNHISQQITEVKSELQCFKTDITAKVSELELENTTLREDIKILQNKIQINEKRTIKNNIVIYGLKVEGENLTENVLTLFRQKLQLLCETGDIRDTYLFLQKGNNRERPILVELNRNSLKAQILANTKKLKGTGIYISPQYTSEDYKKRTFLVAQWKRAKEQHEDVKLRNNYLIINGKSYSYEDLLEIHEEDTQNSVDKSNESGHTAEKTDGKKRQLNNQASNSLQTNKTSTYSVNLRSKK